MSPTARRASRRALRMAALAVLAGLCVGMVSSPSAGQSGAPTVSSQEGAGRPPVLHVVSRGETLWALARRYAPEEDPRRFVFRTVADNDLPGPVILPGQRLSIRRT